MAEKIGQILIRKGKIDSTQLREALRTQQFFGGYLGSHLINLGFIDEASLGETLSEIYRVPFAPFDSIRMARPEVTARVPATLAQRFRLVPIQIEGNRLHLAMLNPRDSVAINEVSAATGLNVTPWVAPEFRIIQALEKHYRLKKTARGPIKMQEKGVVHEIIEEAPPDELSEAPSDYRQVEVGVIGLDGHPLSATVVPELGDSRQAVAPPPHTIPHSLQEWREESIEGPRESVRRGPPPTEEMDREASPTLGLDPLRTAIASAGSRDDIAREVLRFLSGRFRRAAIFAVRQDVVSGWIASGDGLDSDRLREMQAPIGTEPAFSFLGPERDVYSGPIAGDSRVREFLALPAGGVPPSVLLVGVALRDRLVTILYADNEDEQIGVIDASIYKRVARMMGVGFEIIILKNKMKQI